MISHDGKILTNWHVTSPDEYAVVIFRPGKNKSYDDLTESDYWTAKVVHDSQEKDLALLQLVENGSGLAAPPSGLDFITLEEPDKLEVGQDVFAIGHPVGLHWTYTEGVISQIRPRYSWTMGGTHFLATVIQTQTFISYGSSGGPLINRNGKLVGIISNSLVGRAGFNFAIAVHELKAFLGK